MTPRKENVKKREKTAELKESQVTAVKKSRLAKGRCIESLLLTLVRE